MWLNCYLLFSGINSVKSTLLKRAVVLTQVVKGFQEICIEINTLKKDHMSNMDMA